MLITSATKGREHWMHSPVGHEWKNENGNVALLVWISNLHLTLFWNSFLVPVRRMDANQALWLANRYNLLALICATVPHAKTRIQIQLMVKMATFLTMTLKWIPKMIIWIRKMINLESVPLRCLCAFCSKNIWQSYRRTPMPKCDSKNLFIEISLQHGHFPLTLLYICGKLFVWTRLGNCFR